MHTSGLRDTYFMGSVDVVGLDASHNPSGLASHCRVCGLLVIILFQVTSCLQQFYGLMLKLMSKLV